MPSLSLSRGLSCSLYLHWESLNRKSQWRSRRRLWQRVAHPRTEQRKRYGRWRGFAADLYSRAKASIHYTLSHRCLGEYPSRIRREEWLEDWWRWYYTAKCTIHQKLSSRWNHTSKRRNSEGELRRYFCRKSTRWSLRCLRSESDHAKRLIARVARIQEWQNQTLTLHEDLHFHRDQRQRAPH